MLSFCINRSFWSTLGSGLVDQGGIFSISPAPVLSPSVTLIAVEIPRPTSCPQRFALLRPILATVCFQKRGYASCTPIRLLMTDRLNTEPNSDGDVVFTPPELEFEQTPGEYALNHANVLAMMHNNDGVVQIDVVDGGNDNSAPLHPQHASSTSELMPENLVDDGNRRNSQLEGDHANRSYGIYKLLNIYAVSQAGILAAASSARRRMEGSIAIIAVILLKFSEQFRELPKEEYRTWIAQNAPFVVMLMAVSVCILLSFA